VKSNSHKPKKKACRPPFPRGWDEKRIGKVLKHYESQTEDEAVAEDEAAYKTQGHTVMIVPTELVPAVRQLLANAGRHES
jgi:hypothetical protein